MQIIIDGYNLIGCGGLFRLGQPRVESLLARRLEAYSAGRQVQCLLVFDGKQPAGGASETVSPRVRMVFTAPPATADDYIRRLVETHARPETLTVVTSDGAVARAAGARHCQVISSPEFARRISKPEPRAVAGDAEREKPAAETDVNGWLIAFGAGGNARASAGHRPRERKP